MQKNLGLGFIRKSAERQQKLFPEKLLFRSMTRITKTNANWPTVSSILPLPILPVSMLIHNQLAEHDVLSADENHRSLYPLAFTSGWVVPEWHFWLSRAA